MPDLKHRLSLTLLFKAAEQQERADLRKSKRLDQLVQGDSGRRLPAASLCNYFK